MRNLGAVSFAVASRADACAVASVTGIIHSAFTSTFRAFLVYRPVFTFPIATLDFTVAALRAVFLYTS